MNLTVLKKIVQRTFLISTLNGISFPFLLVHSSSAFADSFVVHSITVEGLQRLPESTVLNYLPFHVGESLSAQDSANILETLYKTGLFTDVRLQRSGNTLIIVVQERPTIDLITITGNKAVKKDQLNPVLQKLNVSQGEILDAAKLHALQQGLIDQYHQLGYYAAQVDTKVEALPRNRVALTINVIEGPVVKVHSIQIVGAHIFNQRTLLKNFSMTTSGLLTFYTHTDRYSKTKLDQDLQSLTNFYYNHGYVRFQVLSQQVNMLPDHEHVDLVIHVVEGPIYTIEGFQIVGPVEQKAIRPLVILKPGQVFSREKILEIDKAITQYYANQGYALAKVDVTPRLNDVTHQVFLTFEVLPGPLVYIRHIQFSGNAQTNEFALRSRIWQMEGGPYSQKEIEESKRRLANLPYLKDVQVNSIPVPGSVDQVDLNYQVSEINAGKISAQVGYSDTEGFLYGAGFNEPNFMGSGRETALNFQQSQVQTTYSFGYNNPSYTASGISRGYDLFYNVYRPNDDTNMDESYKSKSFGGVLRYGFPISTYDRLVLGGGYSYIKLNDQLGDDTSPSVIEFLEDHPSPYNQFKLISSWDHSSLDRAIFPTKGYDQSVSAELGVPIVDSSLSYYKLTALGRWYYPLGYGFVFDPHFLVGYGNGYGDVDQLPFLYNYYAGGISTLPGYAPNSLGPKNPHTGNAIGGNVEEIFGVNLIFPNFISKQIRTAWILDAGNIYETNHVEGITYESLSPKNLRAATGLMVVWYSPFGPIEVSLAQALNEKSGDKPKLFDFTFSYGF